MTSAIETSHFIEESTFTVERLDTDGTTVLESSTPTDIDDAISESKRKSASLLDDESIQIVVVNESASASKTKPNGIIAKYKNNSGAIESIIDNIPKYKTDSAIYNVMSWDGLKHLNDALFSDYQSVQVGITPSAGRSIASTVSILGSRPEGRKFVVINRVSNNDGSDGWNDIFGNASDMVSHNGKDFRTPFATNEISNVYTDVKAYAEGIRDAGETVDYLIFDIETDVEFEANNVDDDADHVTALTNDAVANPSTRFGAVLDEMQTFDGTITDFSFISSNAFSTNSLRFNGIMTRLKNEAYNKAIVKPFKEVFPNILVTSYTTPFVSDTLTNPIVDRNGHANRYFGLTGDFQCPLLYGRMDNVGSDDGTPNTPAWMGTFNKTAYNALLKMINDIRYCYRVSDYPVLPWVDFRSDNSVGSQWSKEPLFWDELQYHIPLYGIRTWLYFNGDDATSNDDMIMDDILELINNKLGSHIIKPIDITEMSWDSEFIISGGIWNGRTLWRISVQDGVTDITVDGTPYSIQVGSSRGIWHESVINTTSLTVVDTT